MKNLLIIDAHPKQDSFCSALAAALYDGARENPLVTVELLKLSDMAFDPILHNGYSVDQPLEADLARA
ncbi:NAD(P)H-dependent oxidoreductase, partial [Myxococcota bacterium]|nr:NAD(P)H-dependent oxidoreductase [Myxococcota bacterium]